jgi:hypothetical protein
VSQNQHVINRRANAHPLLRSLCDKQSRNRKIAQTSAAHFIKEPQV